MNKPLRASPLFDGLSTRFSEWTVRNDQQVAVQVGPSHDAAKVAGVIDVSYRRRFGCKGPNAAQWLQAQGLPIPDQPNRWAAIGAHGLIARLGVTEFLVEAQAEVIEPLQQAARVERVYPVPRQDAALLLCGQRIPELLLQVCSFNFRDAANAEQLVVLTSMVGVSVVAIPMRLNGAPVMRLWCDGSFGPYLWTTLVGICEELGGGAAGLAAMPID